MEILNCGNLSRVFNSVDYALARVRNCFFLKDYRIKKLINLKAIKVGTL